MSTEENKTIVRRGLIAWATFDEATFAECLNPNCRDYDGAGNATDNLDKALANLRRHRVAFPDQGIEIHQIFREGDLVSTFSTRTATHTGTYFDVAPLVERFDFIFSPFIASSTVRFWRVGRCPIVPGSMTKSHARPSDGRDC